MRAKLSGPVELVEALESAAQSAPDASVEGPLKRQESAEMRFGVKEFAEIVVVVKDVAELVALCWGGIQILRGLSGGPGAKSAEAAASTPAEPPPGEQMSLPLEITTPATRVRVAIPLESTREQVAEQLAFLQPRGAP